MLNRIRLLRPFSTMMAGMENKPRKFPLNTPIGQMRNAFKEMPHKDFCFFYKQKLRFTYRELDVILILL